VQPYPPRRGLVIAAAIVASILILLGAAAFVVLRVTADRNGDTYARRDDICDLIQTASLAPLSIAERPTGGRTTQRATDGPPAVECRIQVDNATDSEKNSGAGLRVEAIFFPDAGAARAAYEDEKEGASSSRGSVRTEATGVGEEAIFATSSLYSGDGTTATSFDVVARQRNVVVSVDLGPAWDSDWNHGTVRDALIPIARAVLDGLARG
jgi:hypothetical protein